MGPVFETERSLRSRGKVLPEEARAHNRALVLQTLFHGGPMSRADLARETGLTRVTISDLVAESLLDGIIAELGVRERAGPGKPAMEIDIDRSGHHIVGVDLSGVGEFAGAVLDLDGTVLERRRVALPAVIDSESAYAALDELVHVLLDAATRPVLGVGVGSPGLVRPDGHVVRAANLDWREMPLTQRLGDSIRMPVLVRNDANAAVLAEYTFGDAATDTMLIRIGRGVGAGLIAGGRLLTGGRDAAGEIGHVDVGADPGTGHDAASRRADAPRCACGRTGCLEAWVNVPRLATMTAAEPARRDEILADAGIRLAATIAPIVAAMDLSEVVLSGPAELLGGAFLAAATRSLHERIPRGPAGPAPIRLSALDDIVLRGAAVSVLSTQLGIS